MTTYVIGDVQGCFDTLHKLLAHLDFSMERDHLIFAGDMVNRGPKSLATIRAIIGMGERARCVLGNHDLYLLMCACGGRPVRHKDTFVDILAAADAKAIMAWLARQPLMLQEQGFTVVHAGLLPQWGLTQALQLAQNFSTHLQSVWNPEDLAPARAFFESLWSDHPNVWHEGLTPTEQLRVCVNGMTRLRLLDDNGGMDFSQKCDLAKIPEGWHAWFHAPNRQSRGSPLICGHWSAIDLMMSEDVSHIDTGCVWGRKLTALRLPDRVLFQVDAVE